MSARIRHVVAIRFKPEISETQITNLMAKLEALRDHLGGITDFQHRSNISPEVPVVHGFRHLFWFDFENETARDAYLEDTKHQAVGKQLVTAAEGGTEGVIVLDFLP